MNELIRVALEAAINGNDSSQSGPQATVTLEGVDTLVIDFSSEAMLTPYQHYFRLLFDADAVSVEMVDEEERRMTLNLALLTAAQKDFLSALPADFFTTLFQKVDSIEAEIAKGVFPVGQPLDIRAGNIHRANTQTILPQAGSLLAGLAGTQLDNLYKGESRKTFTDDAGHVIYLNGLPTVVIADGAMRSDHKPPQEMCHKLFPTMLPVYVARLSSGEDPQVVMKALLSHANDEAKALMDRNDGDACFTFSCAITYRDVLDGQLKVASIGIGSDMLLLYRPGENKYIPLRSAETTLSQEQKDELDQSDHFNLPHDKGFLPVTDRNSRVLFAQATVTVVVAQENDTLVALSDGAFDGLNVTTSFLPYPNQKDYAGHLVAYRTLTPDVKQPSPEQLFPVNAEKVKRLPDGSGDDALFVYAKIPDPARQAQLKAAPTLESYQKQCIAILERQYPWRPRIFGHHHHQRRKDVCEAISGATSIRALVCILDNQCDLLDPAKAAKAPVNKELLADLWSVTLKNKPTTTMVSGFRLALEEARAAVALPRQ